MKKLVTIGIIALVFFVTLATLSSNPQFSMIQNQSSAVHVKLTHQATFLYTCPPFNETSAVYLNTEGSETVTLNITTPVGTYLGLYSFTNETEGETDFGWINYPFDPVQVVNEYANHSKILALGNVSDVNEIYRFDDNQTVGTLEFWVYPLNSSSSLASFYCVTYSSYEMQGLEFWIQSGTENPGLYVFNQSAIQFVTSIVFNQWHRFTIDFNCSEYSFEVFMDNGTSLGIYYYDDEYIPATSINRITFKTDINCFAYLDAIDFSWSDGYYPDRNNDTAPIYAPTGSYCSPILSIDDIFVYNLTTYCDIPDGTDITPYLYVSMDGGDWTPTPAALNCTADLTLNGNWELFLCYNFTSDGTATPTLFGFDVFYRDEVLNELPQLGDIATSFGNDTLAATISVYVTDPDNDTMTIFLCLPLGTIIDNQTDIANGTIVAFLVICEYSTFYEFYLNVTDGEDAVQSSTFSFQTGAEFEEPSIQTATLQHYLIIIFGLCLVLMIGAANVPKRK